MKALTLLRTRSNGYALSGVIYDDDNHCICDTLENREKAIPDGVYSLDHSTVSPKFSKYPFYQQVCSSKLPRLVGVPHRKGILIHCGNFWYQSTGCILVGVLKADCPFVVQESKKTFERIYPNVKKHDTIIIKTIC